MEQTNFETRDLGFAAYILMKGYKLDRCENRMFIFNELSKSSGEKLSVEYANSCCRRHDSNIMFLRQML